MDFPALGWDNRGSIRNIGPEAWAHETYLMNPNVVEFEQLTSRALAAYEIFMARMKADIIKSWLSDEALREHIDFLAEWGEQIILYYIRACALVLTLFDSH